MGADNATFAFAEHATGHAVVVASACDASGDLWGSRFRPGDGVAGHVLLTGEPLLVDDTRRAPVFRHIGSHLVRSIAAVPVASAERTVGVLTVTSERPRSFVPAHMEFLRAIAEQIATIVARAARGAYLERLQHLVHDLNTPLNALHGFLELALQSDPPLARHQWELLALAAVASEQLIRLAGDMHDSMYLSRGRLDLRLTTVDPVELVRTAVASFAPLATETGLRVACDWRPNVPPIRADRHRVARIIGNLLENAMKFAPSGTTVLVGVEPDGPSAVRFTVDDEGPGFDKLEGDHLVDTPRRSRSTRARAAQGHGFGLNIASALAAAHGGYLMAANRPTGGARVALVLPIDPALARGTA